MAVSSSVVFWISKVQVLLVRKKKGLKDEKKGKVGGKEMFIVPFKNPVMFKEEGGSKCKNSAHKGQRKGRVKVKKKEDD